MLDPVAELAEDLVGDVVGELRAEVHAHTLGPDDPDDLLDALAQRRGRVVEHEVRLVEEEHQPGLVEIADLREVLEELRQEPQQKARIEARLQDELVGGEDVDDAAAARVGAHQVVQIERRLAEQRFPALALEPEERALDGGDRLRADQPVLRRDLLAVVGDEAEQRAQVVEVEQQEPAVVGELEGDFEHALLCVVDLEHATQQARADLADRRADGMSRLASARPATSPFTSAMNTGTPRREKPSAITISEIVLPVPVAPATRPCRFPYLGSRWTGRSPLPMSMSSTPGLPPSRVGSGLHT